MKDTVMKILKYILLIAVTVLFLFPVIYMLACSFMTGSQVSEMLNFSDGKYKELNMIPNMATLEQFYQTLFRKPEYLLKFWNSVVCTFPTVIGQVAVSSLAAFAFAKLKFPKADLLLKLFLATMMIPTQVTIIPLFVVMNKMSLINSYASVILPSIFRPFAVFLLVQQMRTIPNDYLDAASIDGASTFTVYFKVALPLCAPTLATLSITTFMESWNDYLWPLLMLTDKTKMTLPIALSTLNGQFATEYNVLMAGSLISMIPIILIYCFAQKYFQNGMMAGGIKG